MYMFLLLMFFAFLVFFVISYIYEIYVYIFHRENFNKKIKRKIFSAEFGGNEVSIRDRIFFTYPLFIALLILFCIAFYQEI